MISQEFVPVLLVSALTLLINLPFGRARAKARKYSFRWFLCIHAPIPLVFVARLLSHIEMKYILFFAFAALAGQIIGGRMDY